MNTFILIILIIFFLVQGIFALYLLLPFFNLLAYGIIKLTRATPVQERKKESADKNFQFAIVVTAHQDTRFIPPAVDSLLRQQYKNFKVYVVADDCDISGLSFTDSRVQILSPENGLHSKIKSIQYAIKQFPLGIDAIVILDADNLLHPDFLKTMNSYFRKGYRVVQADFKPKNTETLYARMDAIGDMFNFFLEREMRMRLNLSAAIWGAGCAIDLNLYKEVTYTHFLGGFDKRLQSHLVQSVERIAFAPSAILFDEKISSGNSLETQRTRWISSYFKYFGESFRIFSMGVRKFNFNLAYFGFVVLRPPLFIVLLSMLIFSAVNYFIQPFLSVAALSTILIFVLSFVGIVAVKSRNIIYLKTVFMLPFFVLRQAAALFKIKKAGKSFLQTKHHRVVYINEIVREMPVNGLADPVTD